MNINPFLLANSALGNDLELTICAHILLIDDEPESLKLLSYTLQREDYQLTTAQSAEEALDLLKLHAFDLILGDVILPGIDGIELCRQLKQDPATQQIAFILISAYSTPEHLVKGFEAGANDFLTKPLSLPEIQIRIKNQLALKQAQDKWLEYSQRLEVMYEEKNQFMRMAAHDLRSPANSIITLANLLKHKHFSMPEAERLEFDEFLEVFESCAEQMLTLLNTLLDVNQIEAGTLEIENMPVSLKQQIRDVVQKFTQDAGLKNITLKMSALPRSSLIFSDALMLNRILENLVSNAIKFSPKGSVVSIDVKELPESFEVAIKDQGPGFKAEERSQMFRKYTRLSARPTGQERSIGLGLMIVKELSQRLGYELSYETQEGQGSCFVVKIPRQIEPSAPEQAESQPDNPAD